MSLFEIPAPIVKLEMGGANYGMWAFVTGITLQALGLLEQSPSRAPVLLPLLLLYFRPLATAGKEVITGESPCTPAPVAPPRPPVTVAKEVIDSANKDFKAYQSTLDV
ncbi:unnamed protein product [Urochloa humidicola]